MRKSSPPPKASEPGRRSPVTLQDVGRRVGVSHVTVWRALRGSPKVPAARRKQIQEIAAEMGYRPNPAASALVQFRTASTVRPIHAVMAWLNFWPVPEELRRHRLFGANWTGAVAAAEALGYRLEEWVCGGRAIGPDRLRKILVTRNVQGILLPPQRPAVLQEDFDFDWSRFAVIRIGRSVPYPATHVVSHSQAHDTLEACRRIHEMGYRRLGFITNNDIVRSALFAGGYLQAQALLPRKDQLPILALSQIWKAPVAEVLEHIDLWMKKHRPEAILTTEFNTKLLLAAAGYRVPEDVALATTSVSNSDADAGTSENPEEVGRVAVLNLAGLLQRSEFGLPEFEQDILVRGRWQDGTSLPDRR